MMAGRRKRPIEETKDELRQRLLQRRRTLPSELHSLWSEAIVERLAAADWLQRAQCILAYHPVRGEVDLRPLWRAISGGQVLCLPRSHPANRSLTLHRVADLEEVRPGAYGIPEPSPAAPQVTLSELDLILVPGVGYDRRGYRLGYGGGYFDRLLAMVPRALKVAPAFSFQIVDQLPVDPWDRPVDLLVTEVGIITPGHTMGKLP